MTPETWPHAPETRETIAANLARHPHRVAHADERRAAAVAIALVPHGDRIAFLLTLRPEAMARHSGQYALPGGRVDPGESVEQTALRELHEELGVETGPEAVLGRLDDLPTASGWLIAPFVVWLDSADLTPDPNEVAEAFVIPLADLFADQDQGPARIAPEAGAFWHYMPSLGHEVYAPTAAILRQFREVALRGRAAEMLAFREPRFARK